MHNLVFNSSKYNNNSSCQNNNNNNKTSVQVKSLGIGQGPEPQLVVKATQSATLVSASHLSFSARTQHADNAVHNDTHNKYNILHNATLSFSSLPVQCPMIWSQSILFSFNFTSFFLGTSKTFRYFLTSLFQERKVFLFSRILSKSKYFSEVDQVCTILSRVIPFRASKARCSVPVISFFLGRL